MMIKVVVSGFKDLQLTRAIAQWKIFKKNWGFQGRNVHLQKVSLQGQVHFSYESNYHFCHLYALIKLFISSPYAQNHISHVKFRKNGHQWSLVFSDSCHHSGNQFSESFHQKKLKIDLLPALKFKIDQK